MKSQSDLREFFPDAYNQGFAPTCIAKSIRALLYYESQRRFGKALDVSSLFINKNIKTEILCAAGGFESLKTYGACNNSLWDYSDYLTKRHLQPPEEAYRNDLIGKWEGRQLELSTTSIFQALEQKTPVLLIFQVRSSFSLETWRTKLMLAKRPGRASDTPGAIHAAVIVGYKHELMGIQGISDWLIVRNSNGAEWGDRGYFYYPVEDFDHSARELWVLEPTKEIRN